MGKYKSKTEKIVRDKNVRNIFERTRVRPVGWRAGSPE